MKPVHKLDGDYPTMGLPKLIPTFEVDTLDEDGIRALAFLAGEPGPTPKWKLRKHLEGLEITRPKKPERHDGKATPQAFQAQVNVILDKLRNRGFIETTGKGAEFKIVVTEKGQDGYKIYRHVTEPRRAIDFLNS